MTIDRARRRKAVARWHRRFAIFVSIWLIILAGSGTVINHANDWGLDKKSLASPLQQWVYGTEGDDPGLCEPITREGVACDEVFARLQLPVGVVLLGTQDLFLLDESGQLVEKISVRQLGLASLQAVYSEDSKIYLREGNKVILTTPDLVDGQVLESAEVEALKGRQWQEAGDTSEGITWERFLLDLHAARFLGPLASWFNDLMAAFILFLAISGLWLYTVNGKKSGK